MNSIEPKNPTPSTLIPSFDSAARSQNSNQSMPLPLHTPESAKPIECPVVELKGPKKKVHFDLGRNTIHFFQKNSEQKNNSIDPDNPFNPPQPRKIELANPSLADSLNLKALAIMLVVTMVIIGVHSVDLSNYSA